ncbi:MAG: hypothetical protein SF069_06420 [Phycisphaerae bacterium]|nr:hypothetical protein [Phycisphaerae bacterium]
MLRKATQVRANPTDEVQAVHQRLPAIVMAVLIATTALPTAGCGSMGSPAGLLLGLTGKVLDMAIEADRERARQAQQQQLQALINAQGAEIRALREQTKTPASNNGAGKGATSKPVQSGTTAAIGVGVRDHGLYVQMLTTSNRFESAVKLC